MELQPKHQTILASSLKTSIEIATGGAISGTAPVAAAATGSSTRTTASAGNPPVLFTQKTNHVSTVLLYGIPIVSLYIEGQERLCLAQISNTLLKQFSYNEIHNRRVALGITCVQCTPVQLEILRRAGAMPVSSRRCGMITRREAERLCKSFLGDNAPPRLPDDFAFNVQHKCAWGCRGAFLPARYNSSRAKCIKCGYCGMFFSPNKFIFHSHRISVNDKYVQPDAANFNSWRRHMTLSGQPPEEITHAWEDVKAMFNGGTRKRLMGGAARGASSSGSHCSARVSPQSPAACNSSKQEQHYNNSNNSDMALSSNSPKRQRCREESQQYQQSMATVTAAAVVGVTAVATAATAVGTAHSSAFGSHQPQRLSEPPADMSPALMPFSRSFMMDYMWQAHAAHQQQKTKSSSSSFSFPNCHTLPWLKSTASSGGTGSKALSLFNAATAAQIPIADNLACSSNSGAALRNGLATNLSGLSAAASYQHDNKIGGGNIANNISGNLSQQLLTVSAFKPVQQQQAQLKAVAAAAAATATLVYSTASTCAGALDATPAASPALTATATPGCASTTACLAAADAAAASLALTVQANFFSPPHSLLTHLGSSAAAVPPTTSCSASAPPTSATATTFIKESHSSDDESDERQQKLQQRQNKQQAATATIEHEAEEDEEELLVDIETTEDDELLVPTLSHASTGRYSSCCNSAYPRHCNCRSRSVSSRSSSRSHSSSHSSCGDILDVDGDGLSTPPPTTFKLHANESCCKAARAHLVPEATSEPEHALASSVGKHYMRAAHNSNASNLDCSMNSCSSNSRSSCSAASPTRSYQQRRERQLEREGAPSESNTTTTTNSSSIEIVEAPAYLLCKTEQPASWKGMSKAELNTHEVMEVATAVASKMRRRSDQQLETSATKTAISAAATTTTITTAAATSKTAAMQQQLPKHKLPKGSNQNLIVATSTTTTLMYDSNKLDLSNNNNNNNNNNYNAINHNTGSHNNNNKSHKSSDFWHVASRFCLQQQQQQKEQQHTLNYELGSSQQQQQLQCLPFYYKTLTEQQPQQQQQFQQHSRSAQQQVCAQQPQEQQQHKHEMLLLSQKSAFALSNPLQNHFRPYMLEKPATSAAVAATAAAEPTHTNSVSG